MIQLFSPLFIQLDEKEKRFLFVLFLAIIIAILIIVGIGYIINKIFKFQGKRIHNEVFEACHYKVLKTKKQFKSYAVRKNLQIFLKQSWIPLLLVIIGIAVLLIYDAVMNDFSYNPFGVKTGFSSLLFIWDFENPEYYNKFFSITLLSSWPKLINSPHLVAEAWPSYIFVPFVFIGGFWYIIVVQGFFARRFEIFKLANQIYSKDLSQFKIDDISSPIGTPPTPPNDGSVNP